MLSDFASFQGDFKKESFQDCNLYGTRNIFSHAGFTRADKFIDALDVGSHWHLHQIINDDGKILGYVTHINSAQAGGENYRIAARQRMVAGKKITDVSSGSN
ncbi:MAG: hypothetical protein WAW75_05070 [Gallionella sp.]